MMLRRCTYSTLLVVSALAVASPARADVTLPAIFGDNMVLQADKPVPVWGKAEPGEDVEVRVAVAKAVSPIVKGAPLAETLTQSVRTKADDQGKWKVTLAPMPPTEDAIGLVVTGKNKLSIENVLVGEVWICSGQSNMEWSVAKSTNPQEEIANAKYPKMRLFQVKKRVASDKPLSDTEGKWLVCTPETIPNFTAVGYFFGRELLQETGRPVGLIQSAWGGTPAEAWTSWEKLESNETFQPILDRWVANDKKDPMAVNNPDHPAGLYNGMIAPVIPYAIAGSIWYQGESNAARAYQYRTLFPAMITDWRARWGQGDFPFLFVQLANFKQRKDQPADSDWAELREAQSQTLALPKTGQAVIIDIGEAGDIHPKNKQDVGKRLALSAMHVAYGDQDVVHSGPTLKEATFADGKATLTFENVGGGLQTKGGELKGFALAGEDRVFKWAKAEIAGDTIVVSSADVPKPTAVRYAWADNPEATLFNAKGLPASPFRTDDWPGVTDQAK